MTEQRVKVVTKIEANPLLVSRENEYRPIKVAAYCRVSTDDEDQINSYNAQVEYYTRHISENPKWQFAGIYADEGITGTLVSKRERFKTMIRDCEKGKIDLILTKSVSRFARNTVDSLNYVRRLKAIGVGVFFEEQNLNTLTSDSEMYIGLYSVIAQSESENISMNVRWGIQQKMKNGVYAFRYNLLGYRKGENGEPEIVPEEADIIRAIFNMYAEGATTDQIKFYLESNHFLTKTGKSVWDKKIIRSILENEKYVGDMLMQKTFRTDCISKKVKKNNGELPKYLVTNNHPAIIDRATFNFVQAERARRASKRKVSDNTTTESGKYSGKYALTELLICGECGSPYRRRTSNSHGVKRIYWRCLNRIEHGTKYCKNSIGVEEYRLHEAICRAINKVMPNREDILAAVKSTLEYAVTENDEVLNAYNIELNIKELQKQAKDLMLLAVNTEGDTEKYEDGIAEIYDKIKVLREQLEVAKIKASQSSDINLEMKRIIELFEKESFVLDKFDDSIIRRIVECIKVMGDKTIVVILKGGFEITEKLN